MRERIEPLSPLAEDALPLVKNQEELQRHLVEEAAERPSGLIRESVMFFFRPTKTPRDFPIL